MLTRHKVEFDETTTQEKQTQNPASPMSIHTKPDLKNTCPHPSISPSNIKLNRWVQRELMQHSFHEPAEAGVQSDLPSKATWKSTFNLHDCGKAQTCQMTLPTCASRLQSMPCVDVAEEPQGKHDDVGLVHVGEKDLQAWHCRSKPCRLLEALEASPNFKEVKPL